MGDFDFSAKMRLVSCASCGVVFGLPIEFDESRRRSKDRFHCPNGHELNYRGKSTEQVLEENKLLVEEVRVLKVENLRLQQRVEQLEAAVAERDGR